MKLRAFTEQDLDDLYRMTSNPEVAKYMRFDTHTSREEARMLLEEYRTGLAWAVMQDETMIGVFQLKPSDTEEAVYSISIMIDQPYWNQGIAGQLLEDRVSYAREILKARALTAYVVSLNYGSRKALERQGFAEESRQTFPDLEGELIRYRREVGESETLPG